MSEMPILQVKNLHTSFVTDAGEVKAVNGISSSFSSFFPTKSHNLTFLLLFGAVFLSFKIASFPDGFIPGS